MSFLSFDRHDWSLAPAVTHWQEHCQGWPAADVWTVPVHASRLHAYVHVFHTVLKMSPALQHFRACFQLAQKIAGQSSDSRNVTTASARLVAVGTLQADQHRVIKSPVSKFSGIEHTPQSRVSI